MPLLPMAFRHTVQLDVLIAVSISVEMWDGLAKWLICLCNDVAKETPILYGTAIIPWESLIGGYPLYIGVDDRSADGTICTLTIWEKVGTIFKSDANAKVTPSTDPSQEVVDQIILAVDTVVNETKKQAKAVYRACASNRLRWWSRFFGAVSLC